MALYLIAFNDEWVPDHTLERAAREGHVRSGRDRGDDGRRCLRLQRRRSGRVDRRVQRRPEQRHAMFTDGPFVETKEHLGGFAVVDVPDDAQARYWAGRIAVAVGWPQEVHRFPHRIALSTDPQSETLA